MEKSKKLTKIKLTFLVIAILLVTIFVITMFSLWATQEVFCEKVSYNQLKSRVGKYVVVPECLRGYTTRCQLWFPPAEEGSSHRYGKYTNMTVKNEYFTEYSIKFTKNGINGYLYYWRNKNLSEDNKKGYNTEIYSDIIFYYRVDMNKIDVVFDKGGSSFSILILSSEQEGQKLINNIIKEILEY